MTNFPTFFFDNIGQENNFYDILKQNNAFLGYKNKKFKKSKNWHFSKRVNPWYWSKNCHFSNFFLRNIGQKNVLYDILKRKNAFLGYKDKKFKKSKNCYFCKGVNPWFWSKNHYFSMVLVQKWPFSLLFFLQTIGQENIFYDILKRKNAFLGYKTRSSKSQKIDIFPKELTHGFGPKITTFPTFFFTQYRPAKCILW